MRAIENRQIKTIYAIGSALGIVERGNDCDCLHSLLEAVTGKHSVKELGYVEADAVIAELKKRQGNTGSQPKSKRIRQERPGGSTEGQQRKVWALMYELQKLDQEPNGASLGDRLGGVIKKELKVDAPPQNPFAWLDFKAANRLIELLKKYVASAKRKAVKADERDRRHPDRRSG